MVAFPSDERRRLAALKDLAILDTPAEKIYDDVVLLAATICDTPIAVINFIDADRQWGKALFGLDRSEAPREDSFCARTILQDDGLMVVRDTRADPEWSNNPMVVGEGGLRFYAGASIVTDEGHAVGSVCVADDRAPRDLDEKTLDALRVLARQTAAHLKLRELSIRLAHANEQLRDQAIRDGLTGLANRAFLEESLVLALSQSARNGRHLGLLFCDLNGFKAVNDELGHHAGDELLRLVAKRLDATARASDLVARFAGDEFVVLCPDVADPEMFGPIAERFAVAVAEPVSLAGREVRPALSIGTALARSADTPDDLLRRADQAMYEAKRAARSIASH
ncbi:MAG: diguanylate cyclase domain-containing protein [Solirubrobacteraceae bacterium]